MAELGNYIGISSNNMCAEIANGMDELDALYLFLTEPVQLTGLTGHLYGTLL